MGEIILNYPEGPSVIERVCIRGRRGSESEERDVTIAPEVRVMCFEDRGRGSEPRNVGGFQKLEEARKWVLPSQPPEGN